jgi:hypothetical protein
MSRALWAVVDNIFDKCPVKVELHKIRIKKPVWNTTSFFNLKLRWSALHPKTLNFIVKLRAY